MASSLDRQQLGPQMSAPKRHANHPDRYDHPPMPHHLSQDPYQNGPGYPPGPSYPSRVDPGRPPVGMHHHRPPSPPPMSHRDPRAGMDPPGPNAPPLPGMMGMPPDDRYAMPPYHRPSPGPHPPSPSWQNQQLYQGPPPPGASSLPPHLHQPAYNNVPPQHRGSPHMPLPPPHHAAGPPLPPHNVAGGPGSAISESHAKLLASPASASRKSPKPSGKSSRKEKKEKDAAAAAAAAAAAGGSAAMAKNASTETSVSKRGAAKAEKAAAAAAANASNANSTAVGASQAAHDANAPAATESKKDKKRKEVIDRIHRIHFETIENRESLYQELYHALTSSYATLLSNPARSRHYTLELTRLTLQRDAALRETALLHAHQLESARLAYENEKHKVDEEARLAKRGAREKLLAVVEATKKRLQEEKEGGDVAVDAFFDSAQRPHTTRKLRNKASAKRGAAGGAPNDDDSDAPGSVARGVNGHNGVSALGIASGLQELIALSGFGRDEVGGGGGRLGLSSALDLGGLGLTFGHAGRILSPEEEHAFFSKKSPRWKPKTWENLAVGDFVYLTNNDPIPADIIICATSEEEDSCFIETKNLDGETNLKARHAVPELTSLRTPEDCARASLRIDAEPQDTNMYRLNASVILNDRFDKNGNPLQCPVTLNQILLRGCNVRNTKWLIGVVIMTGWDTKIIANSGVTPSKRSMIEKQMNPMVYFNLAVLACVSVACAIADSILERYYFDRTAYWEYGAIYSDDNPRINGLVAFANSLITFQNIVPISLYISFEFVRLAQAYFIYDDYDIWYEKTNRRTTAKSWNLSDDLGQIEYIFSDKTGTLTQNVMIFRECAVAGVIYHGDATSPQVGASDITTTDVPTAKDSDKDDDGGSTHNGSGGSAIKGSESYHAHSSKVQVKPLNPDIPPFHDQKLSDALKDADSEHAKQLGNFFRCLALCHTVLVETLEDGSIEYQAQSPDEQALVQAAADAGFIFLGKERQTLKILTPNSSEPEVYELLVVNEFSSARKRMSVIVRRESDGQVLMLAKGADSIMFERARAGQDEIKQETDAALEEFANKGLRTLCLGGKELSPEYYEDWRHRYHEASISIQDREDKMEAVASELEKDFDLYGATAIEDKLQDGVPETIADLKRAGINVWVATGDKLETAIAIGYSTMLLTEDMNLVVVRGGEYGQPNSAYEQLRKAVVRFFGGPAVLKEMDHQPPGEESESRRSSFMSRRPSYHSRRRSSVSQASLVGEDNGQRSGGFALVIDGTALGHTFSEDFSKDLLLRISTQCKAVICCRVSPLQKALIVRLIKDGLGVMTLAIGDGANDVSMIQAAHVGVGIAGEEGLQAVNSSDYAIAQFRFLKRLVLVHGHWSYYRNSVMITNFFYKQFIQVGTLFWFQIYCAWSTTQAIDYVYILLWNAVWTVLAVIFLGIFDRNINDKVLMQVPELYHQPRKRAYFGPKPFLIYFVDGIYQSVVLFFFFAYSYNTTTARNDGYDINLYEWSTGMAIASVLVANLFVGINARAWTWFIFVGVWAGTVVMFCFAPIYAAFTSTYSYGNNHFLYPSIQFWVLGFLTCCLALLPRILVKCFRQSYYPTDVDILRYVDKKDNDHDFTRDPAIPHAHADGAVYADAAGRPSMKHHTFSPLVRAATSTSRFDAAEGSAPGGVPMHDLRQTASRASSTHYDMLTGEQRPNRGYTFSANEPSGGLHKKSVKDRLVPDVFKRSMRKRDQRKRLTMIHQEEDGEEHKAAAQNIGASQN